MVKKTRRGKSKKSKETEVINDRTQVALNKDQTIGDPEETECNLAAQPAAADKSAQFE